LSWPLRVMNISHAMTEVVDSKYISCWSPACVRNRQVLVASSSTLGSSYRPRLRDPRTLLQRKNDSA